jgi:hypothetical protein
MRPDSIFFVLHALHLLARRNVVQEHAEEHALAGAGQAGAHLDRDLAAFARDQGALDAAVQQVHPV